MYLQGPHLVPTELGVSNHSDVRMVRRGDFDARLAQIARERGATVREGEAVMCIETGALAPVETNRGDDRAPVVIGADGAESIVAKQVGWRTDRHRRAYAARIHNLLTPDLRRLYHLASRVYGLPDAAFPLFAHSPWMQKMATAIVGGDRSRTRILPCACALLLGECKHGSRCDAVLSTLAPGRC